MSEPVLVSPEFVEAGRSSTTSELARKRRAPLNLSAADCAIFANGLAEH